jgi:hypothetical protein
MLKEKRCSLLRDYKLLGFSNLCILLLLLRCSSCSFSFCFQTDTELLKDIVDLLIGQNFSSNNSLFYLFVLLVFAAFNCSDRIGNLILIIDQEK